jgi:hypothetical protein
VCAHVPRPVPDLRKPVQHETGPLDGSLCFLLLDNKQLLLLAAALCVGLGPNQLRHLQVHSVTQPAHCQLPPPHQKVNTSLTAAAAAGP